jgi:VWFA-related protein
MLSRMRGFAIVIALLFAADTAEAQFQESLTVERILLDVRATDLNGEPLLGLTPDDFDIRIGGRRAAVESVSWIGEGGEQPVPGEAAGEGLAPARLERTAQPGRLFVIFVQTDFARNNVRVAGHMQFGHYAEKLIESLAAEDRVAVFSFDSHLKFRLDLTGDKQQVLDAFRSTILIDHPSPPPVVGSPSLASRLDREAMRRITNSEDGLRLIANALAPIPGPKSLLLLGWGLGQRDKGGIVWMRPRWRITQQALDAARVSIFALDTTDADYHELQKGLSKAAEETGGLYLKTHTFPSIAVARLQRTLSGHYEIELRRPEGLRPGTHKLDVRVKHRGTTVLAPSTWRDKLQAAVEPDS